MKHAVPTAKKCCRAIVEECAPQPYMINEFLLLLPAYTSRFTNYPDSRSRWPVSHVLYVNTQIFLYLKYEDYLNRNQHGHLGTKENIKELGVKFENEQYVQ